MTLERSHGTVAVTALIGNASGIFHRLNPSVRWFKTVPSRKLGFHNSPRCKSWLEFGIICPCQAREAIPQPAGLAELVFGDQGTSSVAQWVGPLVNLLNN